MAKYTSRYKELSFYVEGREYKFMDGVFVTSTLEQDEVLGRVADATLVEEDAEEAEEETEEIAADPEEAEAPAPKRGRRKAAAAE
ncbi:hypothetical protein [Paenibacillus wulumuqiensis]|uniref:hypothetical protein n=1 Tax=Paenibacillus wulumuqiensis TaxID=1567107 RepID=UPI000619528E|nr:hypothetical protein [Paenibacillus wulumuqiensis]